ncbi:unnamed protein product [Ostreobium quekettii]|uniref:Uncharacterized protein n=1 Tax=Ostreobium quekettii TaxID=121088 RepID=A0A8S1J9N3_9CHLO|nr:unnamed protein product [Ostreobium quekettii]
MGRPSPNGPISRRDDAKLNQHYKQQGAPYCGAVGSNARSSEINKAMLSRAANPQDYARPGVTPAAAPLPEHYAPLVWPVACGVLRTVFAGHWGLQASQQRMQPSRPEACANTAGPSAP